jgi:hypothetical protein
MCSPSGGKVLETSTFSRMTFFMTEEVSVNPNKPLPLGPFAMVRLEMVLFPPSKMPVNAVALLPMGVQIGDDGRVMLAVWRYLAPNWHEPVPAPKEPTAARCAAVETKWKLLPSSGPHAGSPLAKALSVAIAIGARDRAAIRAKARDRRESDSLTNGVIGIAGGLHGYVF